MRLLSGREILALTTTPGSALHIGNFSRQHLQHTAYYIRLGNDFVRTTDGWQDERGSLEHSVHLELEPDEYVRVRSLETFRLDATVLGILGGVSDTPRLGLALVAGQFIDPLFPGEREVAAPLEFGLKNMSRSRAAVRRHDPIAKVSFFDVSDTAAVELLPESLAAAKFRQRLQQRTADDDLDLDDLDGDEIDDADDVGDVGDLGDR